MSAPIRDVLHFPESDSQHIEPYMPVHSDDTKPFVTLTFATSLDSQIASAPGVQTLLSGPQSKAMTHFLRSRHDAILVGVGTAITDDPSLNCRIEGVGGYGGQDLQGQPRPIVIDPDGRWKFTVESKVMRLAREGRGKAPFVITCMEPDEESVAVLAGVGGKYIVTETTWQNEQQRRVGWEIVLELLAKERIGSVMIEGGGGVINGMLSDDTAYALINSMIVTIAPTWLGQGGVQVCPLGAEPMQRLPTTRLRDVKWVPLGEDVILCGRPNLDLRH